MNFADDMKELRFMEQLTSLHIMARAGTSKARLEHMLIKEQAGEYMDVA